MPASETLGPIFGCFRFDVAEAVRNDEIRRFSSRKAVRQHSDFRGDTSEIGGQIVGAQFGGVLRHQREVQSF